MAKKRVQVILKSGKDQAVQRRHPWVFSGAIKKMEGEPAEGDIVEVYNNHDELLGLGHYQIGSITVRMFSFEEVNPDLSFWKSKIMKAYQMRKAINLTNNNQTNVYRLVFAEGDELPGMIIDYYNGVAVLQFHSIGMYRLRNEFASILKDIYKEELVAIFDKSAETLPFKSEVELQNEFLFGDLSDTVVSEYNNKFNVNWVTGQKTGFFIDQRENRRLLMDYSKDKTVLNTFCYTGGFSVAALNAGAKLVHSVDSSKKAIDLTIQNIELNGFDSNIHQSFASDTLEFLKESKEKYDIIILDPPAYAKHRDVKHNAVQGYKRLNAQALENIKSGGILFTFSCSQVVDRHLFDSTIMSAAIQVGRSVRIMHHLSQPADHPCSIFHPEGEYLKGLVVYVE
ncbi:MAG: class I SAM-dependent rRNA methyltransferase [Bacteroidota bacterium]